MRGDKGKTPSRREFSKRLLLVVFGVMLLLLAADVLYTYTHDSAYSSQLTNLAEIWCGVLTVCIGFYYWKAKTENCKKHAQEFMKNAMKDLCDKYGPEKAVPLIEALSNYVRAITDGK